MLKNREIEYFSSKFPDRVNADPWNPSNNVKCQDLVQKYQDCVENELQRETRYMNNKCRGIQRLALMCYKLEPKYFAEAMQNEMTEEHYLDLYIGKQLKYRKTSQVFKMKDDNIYTPEWVFNNKKLNNNNWQNQKIIIFSKFSNPFHWNLNWR